eukprot:s1541_g23.t1
MVAFVDEWLQRLEELAESQRLKVSKGPSARPHPAGGVPKPLPDPPPDDREDKEKSQQQRVTARMDSYALATFADLQVSEAHREVSKSAVGSTGVSKKSSKSLQKVRKKVAEVMNSQLSTTFWTMMILTNSVYLGIHVEITAVNPTVSHIPAFFYIHLGFASIFTVEVLLRAFAAGSPYEYLWACKTWAWNCLDLFVVVSSWAEMMVDFASGDSRAANTNLRIMRIMRIGRLARVVRVVRVVRLFRALRTLVASLVGTLKSLFWSFTLMALVIYIFGILFTDVLLDFRETAGSMGPELDQMKKYFGNLGSSSATLFRAISDGISWEIAADSLQPAGQFWVQLFHFYVAFCSFALLNVMTGVFCNSAIKAAENDTELLVQSTVQMRKELRDHVVSLFHSIDERGLGRVTITDFEKAFDTEAMQAFIHALQLGAVDAWTFFTTVDKDGDFEVSVDEFTERCMQLHGPAKSVDLFAVRMQNTKLQTQLNRMEDIMAAHLASRGICQVLVAGRDLLKR